MSMKNLITEAFETMQWLFAIVALVIGIVAVITWLTAQAAIQIVAPIVVWFVGAAVCLAILLWAIDYASGKMQSTRLKWAEGSRDITVAKNERHISDNERIQSDIATKSAALRLAAEHGILDAQARQMYAGTTYLSALGEARFASHTSANAKRLTDGLAMPGEPMPKLNPMLQRAQRILISGGQDAGKTTICQWVCYYKLQQGGRVIVIDSHATPVRWPRGCEVIGAAQDYDAIEKLLKWMVAEMKRRYEDQAAGKVPERGHEIISVVSDEWTLLPEVIDNVEQYTGPLLTETRKAGFDFYLAAHDVTVDALGIRGKGGLRKAFDFAVLCDYDFITGERHTYINFMKGGRVSEKDNIEYEAPGPFIIQGTASPVKNDGTPLLGEPTGDVWEYDIDDQDPEPEQTPEESEAIRGFFTTCEGGPFSWNRATQAAFGEGRFGKNYIEKLKRILDKFEIDYSEYVE